MISSMPSRSLTWIPTSFPPLESLAPQMQKRMETSPPPLSVIACEVFRSEIEMLAKDMTHIVEYQWLPMSQHDRPQELRQHLQAAISLAEEHPKSEAIVLIYGLCGNATLGLNSSKKPLLIPPVHDCIALLLGGQKQYETEQACHSRCYWFSPGWICGGKTPGPSLYDSVKKRYSETYDPETVEDLMDAFLSQYESYGEATYLNTGMESAERDLLHTKKCADFFQWKATQVSADLSLLRSLLLFDFPKNNP